MNHLFVVDDPSITRFQVGYESLINHYFQYKDNYIQSTLFISSPSIHKNNLKILKKYLTRISFFFASTALAVINVGFYFSQ